MSPCQPATSNKVELLSKRQLFADEFTVKNFKQKLTSIPQQLSFNLPVKLVDDLANIDGKDVSLINGYIKALADHVEPQSALSGLAALTSVKRNEEGESGDSKLDLITELVLIDNVYRVVSALRPKLLQDKRVLVLAVKKDIRPYVFIEPDYELVSVINKLLPKEDQIQENRITDFQEVYAQVLEQGKDEYVNNFLATDEAKEDEVTREEMEDEYAELLEVLTEDDADNDFPELVAQYAPKLGNELLQMLSLKEGGSKFGESLALVNSAAKYKAE